MYYYNFQCHRRKSSSSSSSNKRRLNCNTSVCLDRCYRVVCEFQNNKRKCRRIEHVAEVSATTVNCIQDGCFNACIHEKYWHFSNLIFWNLPYYIVVRYYYIICDLYSTCWIDTDFGIFQPPLGLAPILKYEIKLICL